MLLQLPRFSFSFWDLLSSLKWGKVFLLVSQVSCSALHFLQKWKEALGVWEKKEKNVSPWISIYLLHPLRNLFWECPTLGAICCSHKAKILLFQECFMSPRNKSSLAGMVKHNVESLWFSPEVEKSFQAFIQFRHESLTRKCQGPFWHIAGICTLRQTKGNVLIDQIISFDLKWVKCLILSDSSGMAKYFHGNAVNILLGQHL